MASEFIDELGRTTRSKDDYFKEAKKIGYRVGKELLKKAGSNFTTQGS